MRTLYIKSEFSFAILWIVVYCVLQSVANPLNEVLGVQYSASAIFCALQAVVLLVFIRRNRLQQKFGLCKGFWPAGRFLFYLPLIFLATRNFWNGAALSFPLADPLCYLACMLCVGFVEEIIFRGFLFRALAKNNVKTAIVISSVTFGLGHFLNLANGSGAQLMGTLFQVVGAIAIGFLFTTLFYRGGSLWPCIITHSAINMTGTFGNEAGLTLELQIVFQVILLAVAIAYTWFLTRRLPPPEPRQG